MKKFIVLGLLVVFVLALSVMMSGCSGDTAPTVAEPASAVVSLTSTPAMQGETGEASDPASESEESVSDNAGILTDILSDAYEYALSARNQLALGTMQLEGSENAVTPEQAGELALYWQALKALSADSTTAVEETTAVQDQIVETMMAEQLEAITAMQLTNADLDAFYVEMGIEITTPDIAELEPGVTPQTGKNSGLTTEEREATRTAAEALGTPVGTDGSGGSGAERRDILLDTLIELLVQRVGE